ncbi:MAG: UDP-N-acetylmuramoyl-L-alanine--D-glutamate ligase [Chitinophagaceae bacterium]|nr:UDP-N-acetylmuramoyl-L-alanine--D-glutamate ligase [Chitinophagaceae bacterium]
MAEKLIILGAGESGTGAAILAKRKGYEVFVSDGSPIAKPFLAELEAQGIPYEQGGHDMERILAADEVVKSPGIPEKAPVMKAIRAKGIPVISEVEFAYRYMGNSRMVAITGSNGKTTTTSLLYHICRTAGVDCALVGNIGFSVARQVAVDPRPLYIAEISSFQLDDIQTFRPDIAILTNITEDHLDRYNYEFKNYIHAKFRIIENQRSSDYFIYCDDDEVTTANLIQFRNQTNLLPFTMKKEVRQGAYIKDEEMLIKVKEQEMRMSINDFALKGKHNQYNTMAAGIAATVLDIRKDKIREAIQTFESLEHRMETVGTIRGVEYINDSKATNINSTWYALESMTKPTVLILGGVDKGNDYTVIEELVTEKVKAIICLGVDNKKIHEAFEGKVPVIADAASAKEAVMQAYRLAEKGDVVLLSPACASFDLFKNYEDRGKQFKEAVREL